MALGRPTKYDKKFCDVLYRMMKKGHSKVSVASNLGVHRDTLYQWAKEHPEFSDAIKKGETAAEAYWSNILHKAARGLFPKANPTLLIFILKAQFQWRDKPPYKETLLEKLLEQDANIDEEDSVANPERIRAILQRYSIQLQIASEIAEKQEDEISKN